MKRIVRLSTTICSFLILVVLMITGVLAVTQRPVSISIKTTVSFEAQFFQGKIFGSLSGVNPLGQNPLTQLNYQNLESTTLNLSPWSNSNVSIKVDENTAMPSDIVFNFLILSEIGDASDFVVDGFANTSEKFDVKVESYVVDKNYLTTTQFDKGELGVADEELSIAKAQEYYENKTITDNAISAFLASVCEGIEENSWQEISLTGTGENAEYQLCPTVGNQKELVPADGGIFIRVTFSVKDLTLSLPIGNISENIGFNLKAARASS